MKLTDLIHLRGEVLVQTLNTDGKLATIIEDKNLIVLNGRTNICKFLAGDSGASINNIVFGSGGTVAGNSNVALPVSPTEITVNTIIPASPANGDYSFTITVEDSPSPRIVFSTVIPQNSPALNGKAISELALMLNTTIPSAFAIKRFPSISKSNNISILISWVIYI